MFLKTNFKFLVGQSSRPGDPAQPQLTLVKQNWIERVGQTFLASAHFCFIISRNFNFASFFFFFKYASLSSGFMAALQYV